MSVLDKSSAYREPPIITRETREKELLYLGDLDDIDKRASVAAGLFAMMNRLEREITLGA